MRRGLRLRLAFHAREMLHVDLERIAIRAVLINQLARQFHLFRWNLVQRINFRVVDNGDVEAVFYRLMQKHRVQNTPGIGVEAETDVAHPEHRFHFRQFVMDALDRLQGLDACRTVFFLSC